MQIFTGLCLYKPDFFKNVSCFLSYHGLLGAPKSRFENFYSKPSCNLLGFGGNIT